jgi:hypothetical protein
MIFARRIWKLESPSAGSLKVEAMAPEREEAWLDGTMMSRQKCYLAWRKIIRGMTSSPLEELPGKDLVIRVTGS